jgi:predicted transposase YdaD
MATRKVFKTTFEIVAEEAELKGKLEGELKGKAEGLRKAIFFILKTTSLSDAEIALELDTDVSFVKTVRQEFLAARQQG